MQASAQQTADFVAKNPPGQEIRDGDICVMWHDAPICIHNNVVVVVVVVSL